MEFNRLRRATGLSMNELLDLPLTVTERLLCVLDAHRDYQRYVNKRNRETR